MPENYETRFVDYNGFIIVKTKRAVGLSTKRFGGQSDVEIWLPISQVGHVTYANKATGDQKMIFVNEPIEAIELPVWLAKEKGLAPVNW